MKYIHDKASRLCYSIGEAQWQEQYVVRNSHPQSLGM